MEPHSTNPLTHISIADAIEDFLLDRRVRNLRSNTISFYQYELSKFTLTFPVSETLAIITPDSLRAHLSELSTHRNPGGVMVQFRVIRTFLYWCWDEYEIDTRNPITRIKPPHVSAEPLPGVKLEHVFQLVEAASDGRNAARDRAILLCLLDTGARRSEFIALRWDDINLITGDILIRNGKGGKSRKVHIASRASKALRSWKRIAPKHSPFVWTSESGSQLTLAGLRQVVRRRAVDAGIPEPGLHDFRRACLLSMLRNGADAVTVSRYAGHADVRVTLRYLAQTDDDMRLAHAKASPVDNW